MLHGKEYELPESLTHPDECHTCGSTMDPNANDEWVCSGGCGEVVEYNGDEWKVIKKGEL